MNIFQRITNYFRKAGASVGVVEKLGTLLDHPRINIDPKEYDRVVNTLRYYRNNLPNQEYVNAKGVKSNRELYPINMTKRVSKYLADLIVNEKFNVTVMTSEKQENKVINEILENNDFKKNLGEYLEPMFALGGLAVCPYESHGEIKFNWAIANNFFPLQSNSNNISEGVFVSVVTRSEGKKLVYYTLLEFHEWSGDVYKIDNELYRSENANEVGFKVDIKQLYKDLEQHVEADKLSKPLFSYLKPSGFNNLSANSPLGLGLMDNCKKLLDRINVTNTNFEHEMDKAKTRVAGGDAYFRIGQAENGVGAGLEFDFDTDGILIGSGDPDKMHQLQDITLKFRTTEYIDKMNYHLQQVEQEVGFQQGTFSATESGIKTATQVVSEDSITFRTRNMQAERVKDFIQDVVISVAELYNSFTEGSSIAIPTIEQIIVDFDDGIFKNKEQELEYYNAGVVGKLLSRKEAMKRAYGLTNETAEEMLQQILAEEQQYNPFAMQTTAENNLLGNVE